MPMKMTDLIPALIRRYGPDAVRELNVVNVEVDISRGTARIYRFPTGLKWTLPIKSSGLRGGPPSKLLIQLDGLERRGTPTGKPSATMEPDGRS